MPQDTIVTIESILETALTARPIELSATHTVSIGAVFHCDATSGAFTVTLPSAGALVSSDNEARILVFIKTDSSANAVTISRAGSDTINAATTQALNAQYNYLIVIDSEAGGVWYIIGSG
jgi:hypothetical protein